MSILAPRARIMLTIEKLSIRAGSCPPWNCLASPPRTMARAEADLLPGNLDGSLERGSFHGKFHFLLLSSLKLLF